VQELFNFITLIIIVLAVIAVIKKVRREISQFPTITPEDAAQLRPAETISPIYHYERRDLIMTRAENEFFKMLDEAVGQDYYVFPQVHLSSLFEHRVQGQDWWKAFHHINRKSVDFVICDRQTVRPLAAIELDDWSHKLDKRKTRDAEVERIFQGANFPLLRFGHRGPYTPQSIAQSIAATNVLNS
jgi:very-short-patch-repair endonuclease